MKVLQISTVCGSGSVGRITCLLYTSKNSVEKDGSVRKYMRRKKATAITRNIMWSIRWVHMELQSLSFNFFENLKEILIFWTQNGHKDSVSCHT